MQAWRLGAYEVVRQLGEGGMAQVYLARDVRLGREVAVKVLDAKLASRTGFKERFLREAQVAAALDHPHIVPLYDFGEGDDGSLYLVMPFISGGSLQDLLRKTPLPVGDVVTYGAQMADALAYAHERGVVHRDVKPANMLLHADGRLMLSDFGLAKILTPESRARGQQAPRNQPDAGTPEYMAPEQIEGQTDERSDIYALGIVLYLLLTGRLPFTGSSSNAVMGGHLYRLPEEPRRLNPAVSPAMQTVIMQTLAKHPADRFQRASDLAAALLSALVAGDAEPLPFLLSNPTPPPDGLGLGLAPNSPFTLPAPLRVTPPTPSPMRTPAGSSGVHAFTPLRPATDGFELPQLGERVIERDSGEFELPQLGERGTRMPPPIVPSTLSALDDSGTTEAMPAPARGGVSHPFPPPLPPSLPLQAPASRPSSFAADAAPRTPTTHRLTVAPPPGAPISPVFPPSHMGMPGLDVLGTQGPASHGLKSGRRQSLAQPQAISPASPVAFAAPGAPPSPVAPVSSSPHASASGSASLARGAAVFGVPSAPRAPASAPTQAQVASSPRRSSPPALARVPAHQPAARHGLRSTLIWIVVVLALAALIAALVVHLSQIHSGGGATLSAGAHGVYSAAARLVARLGGR